MDTLKDWKKEVTDFCNYGPKADVEKIYIHFKNKLPMIGHEEYQNAVKWLARTLGY